VYTVSAKVCDIKYYVKIYTALLQFCFPNVTFPSTIQFLIMFGMGFEVLTMFRIHNVVWVRTPYSLVHIWLWMFRRSIFGLPTQAIRWWKQ